MTRDELDVLLALSSTEWVDADGFDPAVVSALVEADLLVTDERRRLRRALARQRLEPLRGRVPLSYAVARRRHS